MSLDVSSGGAVSNVSTTLSDLSGQSAVAYATSGARFSPSISQGGVSFGQTFASTNVDQTATNDSVRVYKVTRSDNSVDEFDLLIPGEPTQGLSYVTYGQWNSPNGSSQNLNFGTVVFGIQTSAGDMPTTGTATYDGATLGTLIIGSTFYNVGGYIELDADFSTGNVTGSTLLMSKQNVQTGGVSAWRDLDFNATIAPASNRFSGSAASSDSSVTGVVAGGFFGPVSNGSPPEIGGGWRVSGSNESAVGGFVGKR